MINTYFFKVNTSFLNPKMDILDKTEILQASSDSQAENDIEKKVNNVATF
jgi:hypothetical protein